MINDVVKLVNPTQCNIMPPVEIPSFLSLPDDLLYFYKNFSSVVFFPDSEYPFEIISPCDIKRSDFVVLGEDANDPETQEWYTLVKCNDQLISIDLKKGKSFGCCFDSFWDIYGTINDDTLIAVSFTELVIKIINSKGNSLFWINGHN
ncbi:hypothetical protein ACOZ06_000317 [Cronobacter muytjensii]|uniref:SMI1/KNR4 family protein n=1 Tax=Cronobacter muytjensii TaxID=413501 RepID=A0ABQ6U1V8_9ENTR|nr:SMI1/KNR4 family protein [Cronobacter muytjensii]EKS1844531.1 hypothetical protein [Cronobacter muytjensii]ELY3983251.1 hypothetical protein [Cronobacter muytjensii]ELY4519250.1 hypothetical protein [Cronobacter muytjensii]ELY4663707.1 hypothetical protein [Cronobacter muytjensii]ELY6272983.1 hypothetical protein [Cronobacter muytjensii]